MQVRQVDRVTVKGSNHPMGLYTYDLDLEAASAGNWGVVDAPSFTSRVRKWGVASRVASRKLV